MKVLLLGSGGREHALAWKLAQSPKLTTLYASPGNPGIAQHAECISLSNDKLVSFCKTADIDLVIVGPEQPLVDGVADLLTAAKIPVFGCSQKAARLEGSKAFMKDMLNAAKVPTAFYGRFTDIEKATAFIHKNGAPIVVKTDGLAAGKGVIICETIEEAITAASDMLSGESFGTAGNEIVIEEFLEGPEISYFALCDGKTVLPLTSAQDHKRAYDGDKGPNTGGMGTYSPAPILTPALEQEIIEKHLNPTLKTMADMGCPFTGVLFAGLMLTKDGPKMLEYNIRFGDPECQSLMLRMESDLLDILDKAAHKKLDEVGKVQWSKKPAITVVMAAKGYPASYQKGSEIKNLEAIKEAIIFHAGTKEENGKILANGGRVLNICATGTTLAEARECVYDAIEQIDWPEGFYRSDIGWQALKLPASPVKTGAL
ncbi:MAG: phosphoribosylamine--glycine ligase [Micavibrio sp.]|nr:phosphoribosylamine--glycine ligase [Micavibrio sp.]|tara:strand:- start:3756 stop:5042 length:1287 start_codon:yes stop_codon:yes gene_type:complete